MIARELNQYTLMLGYPPIITSCRMEYIRQYDRSNTLCDVDWDIARRIAEHDSMSNFANDMVDGGILEQAQLEATVQMSAFVNALTGSQVLIKPSEADKPAELPQSCTPEIPEGWIKEDDKWKQKN